VTIAGESDGVEGVAASFAGNSENHHVKVARFTKLAIAAFSAVMLVGLYVGTKHSFAIGSFAEQSRVFHLDIGEACLHSTEPAPVFEAREGDSIVLAVTSLYSGALYLHGLEKEINLAPGAETTVTFTAEHAGRFYLHLHGNDEEHAHVELAVLEIAPRQP
jgi:FtsP/CotA-like multicopper oxidase with cupredoxin domain